MTDIVENIGQFYLGREAYPQRDTALLYDAADLTTHALIIGMTGSGKTGLGICLLEEAALDHIPVIAVDPKGDLGNLALNFPQTRGEDFLPWVDPAALRQSGETAARWAEKTAARWRDGIAASGQSSARMERLEAANPVHLYTPGGTAGISLSLLADLAPPDERIRADQESYGQYLDATAGSLLALLKQKADPLGPQHVFLVHVLKSNWDAGTTLSLAELIRQIRIPPFAKIGVLPVNQVFGESARQALSMSLNTLLASPSFAAWRSGRPLDCENLLYDTRKKPQTSVLNIAGLDDGERMFFLTVLLNDMIHWMRRQQGTSTLRAIFYMDEVAGYLPPNANPPSKALFLTLLKQARAFGLGLVLSTQNPVDLDYKALANAGTWCIGRLQTAQDRARVREGLLSAGGKGIRREDLDAWFDRLGKRRFLLHNIHEDSPCIFTTRWAMSYLAGPLNSRQIAMLARSDKQTQAAASGTIAATADEATSPALLPAGVACYYLPTSAGAGQTLHYFPTVLGSARLFFNDRKSNTRHERQLLLDCPFSDATLDWQKAQPAGLTVEQLQNAPQTPARYHPVPASTQNGASWQAWEKQFKRFLRQHQSIGILYCEVLKAYSDPGETETAFRNRIAVDLRAGRDGEMMTLRQKYGNKQMTLQRQLLTAQNALEREQTQASQSLVSAGLSLGGALLCAFTGRKVFSQSNIRRAGSALRKASQIGKERQDIVAAQEKRQLLEKQLHSIQAELKNELDMLQMRYDPDNVSLSETRIEVKSTDIEIRFIALGYRALPT